MLKGDAKELKEELNISRKRIDERMEQLEAKLENASDETKVKIKAKMETLEDERKAIDRNLDTFGESTKDNWKDFKANVKKTGKRY